MPVRDYSQSVIDTIGSCFNSSVSELRGYGECMRRCEHLDSVLHTTKTCLRRYSVSEHRYFTKLVDVVFAELDYICTA